MKKSTALFSSILLATLLVTFFACGKGSASTPKVANTPSVESSAPTQESILSMFNENTELLPYANIVYDIEAGAMEKDGEQYRCPVTYTAGNMYYTLTGSAEMELAYDKESDAWLFLGMQDMGDAELQCDLTGYWESMYTDYEVELPINIFLDTDESGAYVAQITYYSYSPVYQRKEKHEITMKGQVDVAANGKLALLMQNPEAGRGSSLIIYFTEDEIPGMFNSGYNSAMKIKLERIEN